MRAGLRLRRRFVVIGFLLFRALSDISLECSFRLGLGSIVTENAAIAYNPDRLLKDVPEAVDFGRPVGRRGLWLGGFAGGRWPFRGALAGTLWCRLGFF